MEIYPRSMKFQKIYAGFISPTFGRRQNSIRKKKAQREVFPGGIRGDKRIRVIRGDKGDKSDKGG